MHTDDTKFSQSVLGKTKKMLPVVHHIQVVTHSKFAVILEGPR